MDDFIKRWLIQITVFSILFTFLIRILPGKIFSPYIRIFSGMIFILLFIDPLLSIGNLSDRLSVEVNEQLFQMERDEGEKRLLEAEKSQQKKYEEAYRKGIEEQILLHARQKDYPVMKIICNLNGGKPEKITIEAQEGFRTEEQNELIAYIRDFYQVKTNQIKMKIIEGS